MDWLDSIGDALTTGVSWVVDSVADVFDAGDGVTSFASDVVGHAIVGAVVGGITAAITGEDIIDTALKGGLIGGVYGAVVSDPTTGKVGAPPPMTTASQQTNLAETTGLSKGATEEVTASQIASGSVSVDSLLTKTGSVALSNNVKGVGSLTSNVSVQPPVVSNNSLTNTDLMRLGGGLLEGAGKMYGAKLQADSNQDLEDTRYERNKKKVHGSVDRSRVSVDRDAMSDRRDSRGIVRIERPSWMEQRKERYVPEKGLLHQRAKA